MSILDLMKNETNYTTTANGETTHVTSNSSLLDFFSRAGSMRNSSESEIITLFSKAFSENPEYALKALFYMRDIREGNGERRLFRIITKWLAHNHPESIAHLIPLMSEYGRWDDVVELIDTPLEQNVGSLIACQLSEDVKNYNQGNPISLLAKWLPSINASSSETKRKAKIIQKGLGLSEKDYRKILSTLRSYLNIVEKNLTEKEYDRIDYSKVPSQAMLKYRQAFYRNDEASYSSYLEGLKKGAQKINTKTLQPYQLVEKVLYSGFYNISQENRTLYNEMWNKLPDVIGESKENSIAVIDVSGSMSGRPMNVAISLGMYMAERNKGAFKDHFITFSAQPQILKIEGTDFVDKVENIYDSDWGFNTDLESVFDLILNTAIKNNVPQEELPTKLFIISDMQFDSATGFSPERKTFFEKMREKFNNAGYELPKVVFWNVNGSYGQQSPVLKDTPNVMLVSGFSQNVFKALIEQKEYNPYESMIEILDGERYAPIKLA